MLLVLQTNGLGRYAPANGRPSTPAIQHRRLERAARCSRSVPDPRLTGDPCSEPVNYEQQQHHAGDCADDRRGSHVRRQDGAQAPGARTWSTVSCSRNNILSSGLYRVFRSGQRRIVLPCAGRRLHRQRYHRRCALELSGEFLPVLGLPAGGAHAYFNG